MPVARPGYAWAPGYWRWEHERHVWAPGRFIAERPGHYWVPDRWGSYRDHDRDAWRHEAGHWEREARHVHR